MLNLLLTILVVVLIGSFFLYGLFVGIGELGAVIVLLFKGIGKIFDKKAKKVKPDETTIIVNEMLEKAKISDDDPRTIRRKQQVAEANARAEKAKNEQEN